MENSTIEQVRELFYAAWQKHGGKELTPEEIKGFDLWVGMTNAEIDDCASYAIEDEFYNRQYAKDAWMYEN